MKQLRTNDKSGCVHALSTESYSMSGGKAITVSQQENTFSTLPESDNRVGSTLAESDNRVCSTLAESDNRVCSTTDDTAVQHPANGILQSKSLKCSLCVFSTNIKNDLRRHYLRHSNAKHTCNTCKMPFLGEGHLRGHMRRVHGQSIGRVVSRRVRQSCDVCSYSTYSRSDVARHKRKHAQDEYHCKLCKISFKTERFMKGHLRKCHSMQPDADNLKLYVSKRSECTDLSNQRHSVSPEANTGTEFGNGFGINNTKDRNNGEEIEKSFKVSNSEKSAEKTRNVRQVNNAKKIRYTAPETDRVTTDTVTHTLITKSRPSGNTCPSVNNRPSVKSRSYKTHEKRKQRSDTATCWEPVTKNVERIYRCPKCDYETNRWHLIQTHMTRHFPGLYKCDICEKRYSFESEVERHMRAKHSSKACSGDRDSADGLTGIPSGGGKRKKMKCAVCRYSTRSLKKLKRHLDNHDYSDFTTSTDTVTSEDYHEMNEQFPEFACSSSLLSNFGRKANAECNVQSWEEAHTRNSCVAKPQRIFEQQGYHAPENVHQNEAGTAAMIDPCPDVVHKTEANFNTDANVQRTSSDIRARKHARKDAVLELEVDMNGSLCKPTDRGDTYYRTEAGSTGEGRATVDTVHCNRVSFRNGRSPIIDAFNAAITDSSVRENVCRVGSKNVLYDTIDDGAQIVYACLICKERTFYRNKKSIRNHFWSVHSNVCRKVCDACPYCSSLLPVPT